MGDLEPLVAVVEEELKICDPGGKGQWLPAGMEWEEQAPPRIRMMMYAAGMVYSFLGISVVADVFMNAIEQVTSVQKCVRVGNSKRFYTSPVWNETIANLTLMALGSSAPEIMLSLNDIVKRTFVQGKLGASTIVGSAAFNLFVIIAVCINSIPDGESRQIKEIGVYGITAFFSIFAYVWLVFIVGVNGKDEIDVVEGTTTFLYFPVMVILCYYADIGVLTIANVKAFFLKNQGMGSMDGEPKTWLERFKVDNFREEEIDDEEKARREAEAKAKEAARLAKEGTKGAEVTEVDESSQKRCRCLRKCLSCICCCCRRKRTKFAVEADEETILKDESESVEGNAYLSDPNIPLIDDEGEPLENEFGILTWFDYSTNVRVGSEEKEISLKVCRKNGSEGKVTCKWRMETLTAIPGFDYEEDEGEVQFRDGVATAYIKVVILPKKGGEQSDNFQVVLEDPTGGAEFNPDFDGGEDCQRLTINLINTVNARKPITSAIDNLVNLDEIRLGTEQWKEQVKEAFYVGGSKEEQDSAGFVEWINHLLWIPWTGSFALFTPPPAYLGGWVCFVVALGHIAWLTIIVGDLAELFGCVAGIDDNITAISFVALGTSVPDLFASMTAAKQDEYADASIVNVTGSNSVNVFLGIGLPWMLAAFYWKIKDGTNFQQTAGDLSFSVIAFTSNALVTMLVIGVRRVKFGGELGGPSDVKAYSSFLLILLWFSYLAVSIWKFQNSDVSAGEQVMVLALTVPAILSLLAIFAAIRVALRISKEYIGEEGFWGILVAISVILCRVAILFMFQWQ